MADFWKSVYAHNWTTNSYEFALQTLLTNGEYPPYKAMSADARGALRRRLRNGYAAKDENTLVLRTDNVPAFLQNVEVNAMPLEFEVIRPDNVDSTISAFVESDKLIALNYRTLYDKIIRSKMIGISRSQVEQYLKRNPRFIRQMRHAGSKPFVKSYRPRYPFQHWQIDHIDFNNLERGGRKENKGYKHILVVIDIFSKFVYLFPTRTATASETIACLQKIFLSGDIPEIIGADNAFDNAPVRALCAEYGVSLRFGKPHNPQTQGFVENKNKQVKNLLGAHFMKYDTTKFYDILDYLAFCINNTKHSVTNVTPMELHRGRVLSVKPNEFTPVIEENSEANEASNGDCCDEIEKADVQNYMETSKQMYNERVSHAHKRILEHAQKRELEFAARRSKKIKVGDIVKVATFMERNPNELQPVQLQLSYLNAVYQPQNPLYSFQQGTTMKKYVSDISVYQKTKFPKMLRKTSKWSWLFARSKKFTFANSSTEITTSSKSLFKVVGILRSGSGVVQYKLGFNSDSEHTWTVKRLVQLKLPTEYSDLFGKNVLTHASDDEVKELASGTYRTRPDYKVFNLVLPVERTMPPAEKEDADPAVDPVVDPAPAAPRQRTEMEEDLYDRRMKDARVTILSGDTESFDYKYAVQFTASLRPRVQVTQKLLAQIVDALYDRTDKVLRNLGLYVRYAEQKRETKLQVFPGLIVGADKAAKKIRIEFEVGESIQIESLKLIPKMYNKDTSQNGGWVLADINLALSLLRVPV